MERGVRKTKTRSNCLIKCVKTRLKVYKKVKKIINVSKVPVHAIFKERQIVGGRKN